MLRLLLSKPFFLVNINKDKVSGPASLNLKVFLIFPWVSNNPVVLVVDTDKLVWVCSFFPFLQVV
jgi:hypothetical protein